MNVRLPNKEAREMHELVTGLGYRLVRAGDHLIYEHDEQDKLTLPSTPSDWRALANGLARIKRRHPEAFERKRSERRTTKKQRSDRAARRSQRAPLRIAEVPDERPAEHAESLPYPGTADAKARGCLCPRYVNGRGETNGHDGEYHIVVGCPLHWVEPKTQPVKPPSSPLAPKCECGNPIRQNATGRPRKWCRTCRPSQWSRKTEDQKKQARASFRRWYERNQKKAA
jgi:predicted RNA binding protein YcfA (HicA-like mRNA interferase family)